MADSAAIAVPAWIEVHDGGSPLLLFAPHGGRRTAPRRPGRDNVNDLHTAELARKLGATCDAGWIINGERDRNELDLNRVEQVRRRAPWLLELLARRLEELVARHGRAVLLAVHGWNVVQPACDLGVGLVEANGECRPARTGQATVSMRFLGTHLRRLQQLAVPANLLITLGARYPAAHPSNVMQLLTRVHADDSDPALRRLAALADHVEAVQLEIGIPLRWPGARRAAFVAMLADVFGNASRASDGTMPAGTDTGGERAGDPLACGGRPTGRVGLQFADGHLAGLGSIDVGAAGALAGRFLVTDGPKRLALFTGELARRGGPGLCVPHLTFASSEGVIDVRYDGALLSFPMLTPFNDLERGLAAGTLVDGAIDLRFVAHTSDVTAGARFGIIEGTIRLGADRHCVRAQAHTLGTSPAAHRGHPSARVTLPGTPWGDLDLHSTAPGDAQPSSVDHRAFRFALAGVAWRENRSRPLRGDGEIFLAASSPLRLHLDDDGERRVLEGTLARLIPVRRPGAANTVLETMYALCHFDAAPPGWVEVTIEHPAEDEAP